MSAAMSEIMQLMQQDVPECRRQLKESHTNLEKVASYCESNYLHAPDKRHALEETKSYTTQSLASVAYQINTLATHFLQLLNLQVEQIDQMDSSINHLSQTVMIHKEKVARREIGVLTTNKTTSRMPGVKNPGIVFPDQPERPVKYVRKPIDFTVLDEVGHGVKQIQQSNPRRRVSNASSVSTGSAPTTRPPTPPNSVYNVPSTGRGGGTLGRQSSASPYRPTAPPPVAPPMVPSGEYGPGNQRTSQYAPGQMSGGSDRSSTYSRSSSLQQNPPQLPTEKVAPMAPAAPEPTPHLSMYNQLPEPDSPLPPPPTSEMDSYPDDLSDMGPMSPPLPPMPDHAFESHMGAYRFDPLEGYGAPPGEHTERAQSGHVPSMLGEQVEAVPEEYLEKVIAIYNYNKDKEDELSFLEGQVIYVVRKNDDGWWEGVLNEETGLFPNNYVEPCI